MAKKNEDGLSMQSFNKRGSYQPMKPGDLNGLLDMGIEECTALKHRGNVSKFPDTPKGFEDFCECSRGYLERVRAINENPDSEYRLVLDVESWCVFMGITRQTLWKYQHRGNQWERFIDYFKEVIASYKKQLAFAGKMPPVMAVFDLCNNHSYVNTNEFRIESVQRKVPEERSLTTEELMEKARKLPGFIEE